MEKELKKAKKQTKKEKREEKEKAKEKFLEQLNHFGVRTPRTVGQKASDSLTKWAGSWTFIISIFVFLIIWMLLNAYFLIQYQTGRPFDPYPFILLNLILSCLAAIQAPIILMSQNRQGQKDRIKAEFDYTINKKAEREIREIKNLLRRQYKK